MNAPTTTQQPCKCSFSMPDILEPIEFFTMAKMEDTGTKQVILSWYVENFYWDRSKYTDEENEAINTFADENCERICIALEKNAEQNL